MMKFDNENPQPCRKESKDSKDLKFISFLSLWH